MYTIQVKFLENGKEKDVEEIQIDDFHVADAVYIGMSEQLRRSQTYLIKENIKEVQFD